MYLTNKDLCKEIIISKNIGKRTPQLEKMIYLLGKNIIRKMNYVDEEQRVDCLQSGVLRLLEWWWRFDEEVYSNAFAFYTEIFKRAIAAEFNRLNSKTNSGEYIKFVRLEYKNDEGRSDNWI